MRRQLQRLKYCCTVSCLRKRLITRQGEGKGKARETLKDISAMIQEMDADLNNSIRLVTKTSDFPSHYWKHIDAAYHFTTK